MPIARKRRAMIGFYLSSDEGRKDYTEWKKRQLNIKLNNEEESR